MRRTGRSRALAALVGIVIAAGCASTSWTGHKVDELIAKIGPPRHVEEQADGRRVLTWTRVRTMNKPPVFDEHQGRVVTDTGTYTYSETTTCLVEPDGTIVRCGRR